jgi:hypothetical protein
MYRSVIQIFFKLILLFIRTQYFGAIERVVLLCRNSAGLLRSEENKPSALGLYRCVYFLENIIPYIVFLEKISYKEGLSIEYLDALSIEEYSHPAANGSAAGNTDNQGLFIKMTNVGY